MSTINRNEFQVIGVVAESEDRTKIKDYLKLIGCESLRVAVLPNDVRSNYKLSMTPTTLIIANDGTIEKAWIGKWNQSVISDASSVFGVPFSQN